MNIIQKAQTYANLTPYERAFLKILRSLFVNGLTAGLLAAGGYLMAPGMIDLQNLAFIVILAVVFSIAHGIAKYVTASGDPALGAAIDAVTTDVEKRTPIPVPMPMQSIQPVAMPRVRNPSSMDTLPNVPIVQPPQRPPT